MELTVEELVGMSTRPAEKVLAAPEALNLDTRTTFRRAATELLEQLPEGAGRLVIELSGTRAVDSAGLGALMLIQRKASERRLTVCLRGANDELRFLLVLTKLDDLFELESGASWTAGRRHWGPAYIGPPWRPLLPGGARCCSSRTR